MILYELSTFIIYYIDYHYSKVLLDEKHSLIKSIIFFFLTSYRKWIVRMCMTIVVLEKRSEVFWLYICDSNTK